MGIKRILNDHTEENPPTNKISALWQSVLMAFTGFSNKKEGFHKLFYQQSAIRNMAKNSFHSSPSYISPNAFSEVLIQLLSHGPHKNLNENVQNLLGSGYSSDLAEIEASTNYLTNEVGALKEFFITYQDKGTNREIQGEIEYLIEQQNRKLKQWKEDHKKLTGNNIGPLSADTQQFFKSIWENSGRDIKQFKDGIANWYEEYMDRISGWYKKKISLILFIVGLIIAISFKVDSIRIAQELSTNEKALELITNQAINFHEKQEAIADNSELVQIKSEISNLNYGLGLGDAKRWGDEGWWNALLGYIITAFAISMGGPFWYDLLNKVMRLRTSIKSNKKEHEQTPKSSINAVG